MALISIEGMEFYSHHGCFEEEQIIGTKFIVDFHFIADTKEAEKTDDLSKTVDYQAVYLLIKKEMAIKSYILENLARRILDSICSNFKTITYANIKVSKLNPPLGGKIQKVCVNLSVDNKK